MARQISATALVQAGYMAPLAPSVDRDLLGPQGPDQAEEASLEAACRGSWAAQG